MKTERSGLQPAATLRGKTTVIVVGALIITAFLAGFIPSSVKARRVENELRQVREENRMVQLRDLAGLAYLQASQKNYGLAAGTCTGFFQHIREAANQARRSGSRETLEGLLAGQERITAELAKGDAAVLSDLETLSAKTREATVIILQSDY